MTDVDTRSDDHADSENAQDCMNGVQMKTAANDNMPGAGRPKPKPRNHTRKRGKHAHLCCQRTTQPLR